MQIGSVFTNNKGDKYVVKEILFGQGDVRASRLRVGKDGIERPSVGRPSRFSVEDVAKFLGEDVQFDQNHTTDVAAAKEAASKSSLDDLALKEWESLRDASREKLLSTIKELSPETSDEDF